MHACIHFTTWHNIYIYIYIHEDSSVYLLYSTQHHYFMNTEWLSTHALAHHTTSIHVVNTVHVTMAHHRGIQFIGWPYYAHVSQVNCCWFPGVAPFLVGHLSGFMVHVHKSQRTSSVCLTVKKWKGSTIQTRDSLCVSHRGSKRQGVSSSHSHSHPNLERIGCTQAYFLLVSSYSELQWHWLWDWYQWCTRHIKLCFTMSYYIIACMNNICIKII